MLCWCVLESRVSSIFSYLTEFVFYNMVAVLSGVVFWSIALAHPGSAKVCSSLFRSCEVCSVPAYGVCGSAWLH